jgi:hypothetical protein
MFSGVASCGLHVSFYTFVPHGLALQVLALEALERRQDVILVLPFVSIVEEKVAGFQQVKRYIFVFYA